MDRTKNEPLQQFKFQPHEVSKIDSLDELKFGDRIVHTKHYDQETMPGGFNRLGKYEGKTPKGEAVIRFADCVVTAPTWVENICRYSGPETELSMYGGRFKKKPEPRPMAEELTA